MANSSKKVYLFQDSVSLLLSKEQKITILSETIGRDWYRIQIKWARKLYWQLKRIFKLWVSWFLQVMKSLTATSRIILMDLNQYPVSFSTIWLMKTLWSDTTKDRTFLNPLYFPWRRTQPLCSKGTRTYSTRFIFSRRWRPKRLGRASLILMDSHSIANSTLWTLSMSLIS